MSNPKVSDQEQERIVQLMKRKKMVVFLLFFSPWFVLFAFIYFGSLAYARNFGGLIFCLFPLYFFVMGFFIKKYFVCPHCGKALDYPNWLEKPSNHVKNKTNLLARQCIYCGVYLSRQSWEHELWVREWKNKPKI